MIFLFFTFTYFVIAIIAIIIHHTIEEFITYLNSFESFFDDRPKKEDRPKKIVFILDCPKYPSNIGTVLRYVVGIPFFVKNGLLYIICADYSRHFQKKCERIGMLEVNSKKDVAAQIIEWYPQVSSVLDRLRELGYFIVVVETPDKKIHLPDESFYYTLDPKKENSISNFLSKHRGKKVALIFGNEETGCSEKVIELLKNGHASLLSIDYDGIEYSYNLTSCVIMAMTTILMSGYDNDA